ncbi:right-handed parallel beta-helix repeat-containing protein [archaeon]|nr:right-handed parallel beta-helix repeat-containing protein [archaeon]
MKKSILLLFLVSFIFVVGCSQAKVLLSPTQVACGSHITESVTLTEDILDCSGDYQGIALKIIADDIVLDCNGHSIEGVDTYSMYGVFIDGRENVIVKNCNIHNFGEGIRIHGGSNNSLIGNNIEGGLWFGIRIPWGSTNNIVTNNTITNIQDNGITMDHGSENNFINSNWISACSTGIWLESNAPNNIVSYNFISNIINHGILIKNSPSNEIFGNTINNGMINGIWALDSSNLDLKNNLITNSGGGIRLTRSDTDEISKNNLDNNHYGIYLDVAESNLFWGNNFSNNVYHNAFEEVDGINNDWNFGKFGNNWDDFESNPGYPNYYEISGPGDGIDWQPYLAPQPINYYDDFSGETLDLTKWIESTNYGYFDEHFVQEGVYHTQQLTPKDADVILLVNRDFYPGSVLEHDVNYVSGEGNQQFQYMFNVPTLYGGFAWLEPCSTPSPGCNGIGHWNGDTDVGIQKGIYHRKLEFLDNSIKITTTRPDGTKIIHTLVSGSNTLEPPYKIYLIPHTGHNGVAQFDFDNFLIIKKPISNPIKKLFLSL